MLVFTPKLIPPLPGLCPQPPASRSVGSSGQRLRRPDWSWGLLLRLTPGRLQAGDGDRGPPAHLSLVVPAPHRRSPSPRPRTPMSSSDQAGQYPAWPGWGPQSCAQGEAWQVGGAGPPGPPGQPPADSFVCDTSLPEGVAS